MTTENIVNSNGEQQTKQATNDKINASGLTQKLLDLKQTRIAIDNFKRWESDEMENNITHKETKRNEIIFLAQVFENKFKDEGFDLIINQICTYIDQIFTISDLSKYSYLIVETLPEKYKDSRGRNYAAIETRLARNRLGRGYNEINEVDLSKVDADSLKQFYDNNVSISERIKEEMSSRGILPSHLLISDATTSHSGQASGLIERQGTTSDDLDNSNYYSEFDGLKQNEEDRFKQAKVGEPFTTAEKLCAELDGYAEQYQLLDKALLHSIKIAEVNREWWTVKYPPLTTQDCKAMAEAIQVFNKLMLPFADRKYRRDHYQMLKICSHKVIQTSVKASKESRIPCGHHFDKNGLPIFREMTKEQIDATYVYEFNYILKLFNTFFGWYQTLSKVNESHGGRNMEDRAVDLHGVLEFHA